VHLTGLLNCLSKKLGRKRANFPAASDLSERVFKPVHHIDTHAVLCAAHRIEDRFPAAFGDALDDQMSPPRRDVGFEFDRGEDRVVQLFKSGGENVEDSCSGLGVLTAQDAQQPGRPLRS
jgi:hypothetical protein